MSRALRDCLPFFLFFTLLTFFVKDNAFFWDATLQASKFAHFYYENNFQQLIVPAELDAGHPPLFGIYLALIWKVFGKSLAVAHFAMLPFLLGIVWQVYRLINYFIEKHHFTILLLVLSNTILLGHSVIVSPDIVFLFCYLLALNGVLYLKKWQIILGTIALGWLSIRGIFAVFSLFIIHLSIDKKIKALTVFIPVFLTMLAYYGFHYIETGWWLSTPNTGWSHHRGIGGVNVIFKNIIILGWRLIDFGNIILCLLALFLFLKARRALRIPRMRLLFSIPFIILICYAPALVLLKNPIAHRYLLPFYIVFALLVSVWLMQSPFKKKYISVAIVLVMLSGNFWVYPKKIAQGWDCTLAHLPYYGLVEEMIGYIDQQKIAYKTIGTEFPNIGARKYIDLGASDQGFKEKDMQKDAFIFYSNVYNDFSDEALKDLENNWKIEKALKRGQVCVILYKRK